MWRGGNTHKVVYIFFLKGSLSWCTLIIYSQHFGDSKKNSNIDKNYYVERFYSGL